MGNPCKIPSLLLNSLTVFDIDASAQKKSVPICHSLPYPPKKIPTIIPSPTSPPTKVLAFVVMPNVIKKMFAMFLEEKITA